MNEEIDIEKLRVLFGEKVAQHRDALKAKLAQYGAFKVSDLEPEFYEEVYNFAKAL